MILLFIFLWPTIVVLDVVLRFQQESIKGSKGVEESKENTWQCKVHLGSKVNTRLLMKRLHQEAKIYTYELPDIAYRGAFFYLGFKVLDHLFEVQY